MDDKELQRQQEIQAGKVNKEEEPVHAENKEVFSADDEVGEEIGELYPPGHPFHSDTLADRKAFEGSDLPRTVTVGEELDALSEREDVTEQTPVPNRTLLRKPYRVEGGEVLDADGDRVASAGYNSNRKTTGPAIALLIAEALNRY